MKDKFPPKTTSNEVTDELAYCHEVIAVIEKEPHIASLPAVKEKLNVLKEVVADYTEQLYFSADQEAQVGYKSVDDSFFGYKTHLAMSDERIITAAIITSGEQSDGKYLKELVEKTKETGMQVDTVIGDTAYSGKDNLTYVKDPDFNKEPIQLISKLHPVITNGQPTRKTGFEFNKDANTYACPAGHLAQRKSVKKRSSIGNGNDQLKYYFDVEKCRVCPMREGCYKPNAKTKTYSITIKSTEHIEHEAFQETEEFKELAKLRYKIEAKNNELKNRHGLKMAKSSGLFGMQIQGATTIFVVNLKRILKLLNEKE